jgi:predicted DNA binding CopG/RHH family protein
MSKLDKEEKEILDAFESRKLKRTTRSKVLQKRHQEYADAMFRKDARINIRLSCKDL